MKTGGDPLAPVALWAGEAARSADWSVHTSEGSRAELAPEAGPAGLALRLDFALEGHGAFAIARRELSLVLPDHWVVVLALRGEGPPVELQVKLVDESGANVWWWRERGFAPPQQSRTRVLRRAALDFAWGPRGGGEPDRLGAVEVAVAADADATGTLWLEALRLEPRPQPQGPLCLHAARASSQQAGHEAACVLDGSAGTSWRPEPGDPRPWLELDLGESRECGGLTLELARRQAPEAGTPPIRLLGSDDAAHWTPLARDPGGATPLRFLRGEAEARWLRVELPAGAGGGLARVAVVPIELAVSPARYAAARARAAPRGRYPRHLLGEQAYWALVSADGDGEKALLGEDGALEVGAESFSLEPFLRVDGHLHGWAEASCRASLAEGSLPVPSVAWEAAGLRVRVTAFVDGRPGESTLVARYEVENPDAAPRRAELLVAIRPFQVTPAWQSVNLVGGVAPIERLERAGACVRVDARSVVAVTAPDGFGAATGEEGLSGLWTGALPERSRADDPTGFAEGALAFELELAPGARGEAVLAVPLFDATPAPPAGLAPGDASAWATARHAAALTFWRERLADVPLSLPPSAAPFEHSLRAGLAWILADREGPRIQPGPRCYRRAWIRDGALTGMALAEWGFADEARAFLRWYAPYQLADGRVPCAVDRRGADPVPEHDSHGELVWAVVELYRLTGDAGFLAELWPHASRAAEAIEALRAERSGEAWRGTPCFGLLPESISHEGYASRPVHSYWDDWFAVRGLADAAQAAAALGDAQAAARFAAARDAMRAALHASLAASMARHRIDFLPGSVELGDLDPTSTAIAIDPCGEGARLPRAALERTFEHYWQEFETRRAGRAEGDAYTPYEVRNAAALLHLGWKERALALLEWLIADQRPTAWRQWPEVAHRDRRAPRFLGDLPHAWVAASFARALRRLLAWEDDEAGTLLLAAGIPEAWALEAPGVRVRGLPTHFGPLDLTLEPAGPDAVRARVGGACRPPRGAVLVSPLSRPLRQIEEGGRARRPDDPHRVVLRALPAELVLRT